MLTGDGELQEGSNWEADDGRLPVRAGPLTVIVDRNRLQQGATTRETNDLDPLDAEGGRLRLRRRRGRTATTTASCSTCSSAAPFRPGKPTFVIAHTHKGHPISFMCNNVAWHHKVPDEDQLAQALDELGSATHRTTKETPA